MVNRLSCLICASRRASKSGFCAECRYKYPKQTKAIQYAREQVREFNRQNTGGKKKVECM